MDVLPAIDVLDGRVVRLTRGQFDEQTIYDDDPVRVGSAWVEQGAALLHVVDLEGARRGRPPWALARMLGGAGLPFQVGGGIRDAETAEEVVALGAERVVMGTAAIESPRRLRAAIEAVGSTAVVVALDVRAGRALGSGWRDHGRRLQKVLAGAIDAEVTRVLLTGIARDGTMRGPDLRLLAAVQREAPGLHLIASGGVGSLDDIAAVRAAGAEAVVVGRAFYEERFSLSEAMATAQG